MTCKDCENHDECERREKLLFAIDDLYELIYQHHVDKSCKDFKKAVTNND